MSGPGELDWRGELGAALREALDRLKLDVPRRPDGQPTVAFGVFAVRQDVAGGGVDLALVTNLEEGTTLNILQELVKMSREAERGPPPVH